MTTLSRVSLLLGLTALLAVPASVMAAPTISGNQLTWQDEGWHQVQRADTFETICEGSAASTSSQSGGPCTIDSGFYIVINHSTGERFENITAGTTNSEVNEVTIEGNTISWPSNGWYQLQASNTFATVCEGVQSCSVQDGEYTLINHTTGARFEAIRIGNSTDVYKPITSVSVSGDTIVMPNNGWYQVQDARSYASICGGVSTCKVSPGNYIVINHTSGTREEITVLDDNAIDDNVVVVDLEITVPTYVSNELQVKVTWGDIDMSADWLVEELWFVSGNFSASTNQLLTVTFYDRNGEIILGTADQQYRPQAIDGDNLDLVTINASDFQTHVWDDDADGISNLEELRRGTDPLIANDPANLRSFDLAEVDSDLISALAGYQLELFSSVVDDLAFIVSQQTTITWPDNAYYQVQHAYRFTTVCEGGPSCNLVPGSYLVINHDTGERELIDLPYIDPALLSNNVELEEVTLTLNDAELETDSVNLERRQYQCELGGSLITGLVKQRLDSHQSNYRHVTRRTYEFDQCQIAIKDSLISDGIYTVNGSMYDDSRNYGGYENFRDSYGYDNFSLIGDNGLQYRISGNTEQAKEVSNKYVYSRSSSIREYQKINKLGEVEESIRNSEYHVDSKAAGAYWDYKFEVSGQIRSEDSANQWVTATTTNPLMQHWHSPDIYFDHGSRELTGGYRLTAEDGSSLNVTANACFVDESGVDCKTNRAKYVNYDYRKTSGENIKTVGVLHVTPVVKTPICKLGTLRRTHIMPGEPYISAIDEGRLECTGTDRWHTDLYGRYTFGPVIDADRIIIIP